MVLNLYRNQNKLLNLINKVIQLWVISSKYKYFINLFIKMPQKIFTEVKVNSKRVLKLFMA